MVVGRDEGDDNYVDDTDDVDDGGVSNSSKNDDNMTLIFSG